jgi:hypothetical protein
MLILLLFPSHSSWFIVSSFIVVLIPYLEECFKFWYIFSDVWFSFLDHGCITLVQYIVIPWRGFHYAVLRNYSALHANVLQQMSSRREICDDHNSNYGQPKSESLKVASTDITDTLVPEALPRASSGPPGKTSGGPSAASQGGSSAPQERSSALPVAGASSKPVWQVGYCLHCAAALVADEACTHNPVLQRVKVC